MKVKKKKLIMVFLIAIVAIGFVIWNSKYAYIVRMNHYIKENNVKKVEKLLINPKDINFSFSILDTGYSIIAPIEKAAIYGNPEIVRLLIENGAKGDSIAITNHSALKITCMSTRYDYETKMEILKLLLDAGADVNRRESGTPYGYILSTHNRGEYENYNDTDENYPNIQKEKLNILKLFMQYDLDIDGYGGDYLFIAARKGNIEVVKYLVEEEGIHIDTREDDFDATPLMEACGQGQIDIIKYLIENGADRTLVTSDGWTALKFAEQNNQEEVIELLDSYE